MIKLGFLHQLYNKLKKLFGNYKEIPIQSKLNPKKISKILKYMKVIKINVLTIII